MAKIDDINHLVAELNFQNPYAESNVSTVKELRGILGSESFWISDGHKYTLVVEPYFTEDETPWHIKKESWRDVEEPDVMAMPPDLADAIQQTLENPDDFTYSVRVDYEIEHFEHNGRLIHHLLDDADYQDNDGTMFAQSWRTRDFVESMAVLNSITEMPLLGTVSVVWNKIPYTQEDRAEDAARN